MADKIITFKTNSKNVITQLLLKNKRMLSAIQTGMQVGVRLFGGETIKEQMSGRSAEDVYLNTGTGNLKKSWHLRRDFISGGDFSVVWGTNTKYAAIHQYGGITGKYNSIIPKRLFILEKFALDGMKTIREEVLRRLRRVLQK